MSLSNRAMLDNNLPEGRALPDGRRLYRIFIRDFDVSTHIGVTEAERSRPQILRISMDIHACDICDRCGDDSDSVICYSGVSKQVRRIIEESSPSVLLEALAEKISGVILSDPRIATLTLSLTKPQVLAGEGMVGIEIYRQRSDFPKILEPPPPSDSASDSASDSGADSPSDSGADSPSDSGADSPLDSLLDSRSTAIRGQAKS